MYRPRRRIVVPVAETIAIGSELLVGGRTDSNSLLISELLGELGIEVRFKSVVGDSRADIVKVLKSAAGRAGVIVMTGGLGPTVDDCTRQAVSALTGKRLARRREAYDGLKARLAQWGRTPNKGQLRQALVPSGASVLANPVGSAPGFWMKWRGTILIALPGVPSEMDAMMKGGVIPLLLNEVNSRVRSGSRRIVRLVFHTWGLPEADVDMKLTGLMPKQVPVDLGLLASPMGVLVSLTTRPRAVVEDKLMTRLANDVRLRLGEWIFSEGRETMEEVVGRLLIEQNRTIALAESCTGGLIGHRITQVPGSSAYFDRGVICYSNKAKSDLLGVPPAVIDKHGAVSAEVAAAMAKGVREQSAVSVGLSVTGIAGPSGATATKPVGLVYIGLDADNGDCITKEHRFHGDRSVIKQRASQAALDLLRRWLRSQVGR